MADTAIALNPPGAGLIAGWRALPPRNKLATMIAAAASVAVLTAAWLWSQAPDYKVLFTNIPDKDGGAIIAALNQQNVPYKLEGGAIQVPAPMVNETRMKLASLGLPKSGTSGFELIDQQKFGATQFQEQVNYQRALEGELTKSILSLAAVQSARIHLAIPKPSIFMREQMKPTASVLLSLYPGKSLDRSQIAGIMHLVSSSLPDLPTRNVSIVDQNGTLLSPPVDATPGQLDANQLSHVRQVEQDHMKKVLDILTPLYGADNVKVQVAADLDFSQSESHTENFKPNQGKDEAAILSQQISESSNGAGGASGVPGTLSNQPPGAASAPIGGAPTNPAGGDKSGGTNNQSRRESVTNYVNDKTVRHVKSASGSIRRLSAAVVINHRRAPGAKPGAAPLPLPAEELTRAEALVKEAMGFSKDRGDSVSVQNAAFTPREVEVIPEIPLWKQPDTMAFARDIGKQLLIAGVVLYILLGVLRPMLRQILAHRPAPPEKEAMGTGDAQPGTEGEVVAGAPALPSHLENARALAKQDPKIVANVVRAWVNGNE